MYRIRIHGRGGQGIKMASRILGTALFRAGFQVQDAPKYGAERRGAPIFAYVRADRAPICERGVIQRPDLVVIADDTLVAVPAAATLQGLGDDSVILINSHHAPGLWRDRLNLGAKILILPASEEVEDRAELPFVGATCTGAAACLLGVIERDVLAQSIEEELGDLGADIVERNLHNALAAFDAMAPQRGLVRESPPVDAGEYAPPDWIELPFDAASVSAPSIHAAGNSVQVRTGLWRTLRPVIDYDRCNNCWWICSTFCPDSAITVSAGRPEIDYDHCKGCMVCVGVCPTHAIETLPEYLAQERDLQQAAMGQGAAQQGTAQQDTAQQDRAEPGGVER
jgi:pyruvate ferredoxin oxidoreductase gamma subunit